MKRGGKFIGGAAALAVAACGTQQGQLSVRAIPTALAKGEQPASFRVMEGRAQLALGNAALALESFRKASREDPTSIDALVGIAASYDRMGRYDLSRRNYEAALALAPGNTRLLGELAASLELQGLKAEAAEVRLEIAERQAAAAVVAAPAEVEVAAAVISVAQGPAVVAAVQPVIAMPTTSTTTEVAAREIAAAEPVSPELVQAKPVTILAAVAAEPVPVAAEPVAVAEDPLAPVSEPVAVAEALPAEPARSVTIKLPPPRPAPAPVAPRPQPVMAYETRREGPRLERLSMAEVALVTEGGPQWRSELLGRSATSVTVRFVPLRQASEVAEVRLLNAARVHRLAARTRAYLNGRGWRGVSIGDADSTRSKSIIFYPSGQQAVARKLSKQFGFAMAPRDSVEQVTVLLGRDSVRIAGARSRA